jgi:hypothetical protein
VTRCWASLLGGCDGKVSREHIVSANLLAESVTFRGFFLETDEVKTIGRNRFVSKCLCRGHNSQLSPCDSEAKRFREIMEWWGAERQSDDGPNVEKHVDAFLLAKWFAKTVCNVAAVSGKHVPRPLVRYAFSAFDDPFVHVYFLPGLGDVLEVNRDTQEFHWLRDKKNEDHVAVVCYIFGLPFLISTFDVAGLEAEICERLQIQTMNIGMPFLDRIRAINVGEGFNKRGTIILEWPDVGRDLDVNVDLFVLCRSATADGGTLNLLHTFDVIHGDTVPLTHRSCAIAALLRFGKDDVGSHEIRLCFEDEIGKPKDYLARTIEVKFHNHTDLPTLTYPFIADISEISFPEFGDYKTSLFVDGKRLASRPIFVRQWKTNG